MIVFIKQASTVLAIVTEKSFYDFKSKLFDFLLKRVSRFHELNYLFKLSFIYVNDYFFGKKETKLSTSVHSVGFTDWGICVHML